MADSLKLPNMIGFVLIFNMVSGNVGLPRLLPIVEKTGTFKMVRVLSNDAAAIGRVLDLGADGVIVPMIDTVEQAAAACRYPPTGSTDWRWPMIQLAHANDAVMCVVMIETARSQMFPRSQRYQVLMLCS